MKKKLLLTFVAGFLIISSNLNAQFKEISGASLETTIYSNHQKGLPGYQGLYNNLLFKVKDYSILKSKLDQITKTLNEKFNVEKIELKIESEELIVVYDKTKASTDDFLKVFKEILSESSVYLTNYTESTLIKSEE